MGGNFMRIGVIHYLNCAHKTNVEKEYDIHGHTYKIEVSIEGNLDSDYLLGFEDMKKIVADTLSRYNYTSLNKFMKNPTVENFTILIYNELKEKFKTYGVHLKVWQGNDCWVEYP